jgi:hypothetical protein
VRSTGFTLPSSRAPLVLAVVVLAQFVLDVVWLRRFRFSGITGWDESGYMSRGLNDAHAFVVGGPLKLLWAYEKQAVEAPLVSLLAVPGNAIFGLGVFQSLLLIPFLAILLTVATYALARKLVGSWWAVLAALVVASMPVVTDYSREFVFPVPAAAFMTLALWAILSSDYLRRTWWVAAAGAFVGGLLLSRTMTVSFLPGIAVVTLGQLLASRDDRGERALRLLAGAGVAAVVAGSWYLHNWPSVYDYLTSSGYGSAASSAGTPSPVTAWHYWSKELGLVLNQTYLPLAVLLALVALVSAALWLFRTRRPVAVRRELLGSASFALAAVVVEGYLVLTSSTNEGSAFALPFLPALVILAVAMVGAMRSARLAAAFAALLVAVSVANLAMKAGVSSPLARVRTTSVLALGPVTITDGRGLIQAYTKDPTHDIPAWDGPPVIDRRWQPFARRFTGWLVDYAARHGQRAYILTATDHQFTNQTWVSLADSLWFHGDVFPLWPGPVSPHDTVEHYRAVLGRPLANFVETTSNAGAGTPTTFNVLRVHQALRSLDFRKVKTFRMPDGGLLWLWWKSNPLQGVSDAGART